MVKFSLHTPRQTISRTIIPYDTSLRVKIRGFTIVEMLIIAPIVLLMIGAMITAIVAMTGEVLASRSATMLAYNIQDTLDRIEYDSKNSTGFMAVTTNLNDGQGYDSGTSNFSNAGDAVRGNSIIMTIPATTGNPINADSKNVYLKDSPNACGATQNKNSQMYFTVVYFVKDSSLWRRTIAPPDYTTAGCDTPWQKPSCAAASLGSKPFCKTEDTRLLSDIEPSEFVVNYFTAADTANSIALASSLTATALDRQSALDSIKSLTTTFVISQTAAGHTIDQSGTMRAVSLAPTPPPVIVSTFAGSGNGAYVNGIGTAASFYWPTGIAVDTTGTVFVSDYLNNRIRKISPAGAVTLLAGSGINGYANGTGSAANFGYMYGITVDSLGNAFVSDSPNNRIRKITPAGVVTTLAGSGAMLSVDGTGTAASMYFPDGIAIDSVGNLYVAELGFHRIRKITPAGAVTTLAGTGSPGSADGIGTAASFYYPSGIAIDSQGTLYIADSFNNRIRKLTTAGVVTTIAGSGATGRLDATGTAATFNKPTGVAVNSTGTVYVADQQNNLIRKISPAGAVTTFAGSGVAGYVDGNSKSARFDFPSGVAVDSVGTVYVTDHANNRIRIIK